MAPVYNPSVPAIMRMKGRLTSCSVPVHQRSIYCIPFLSLLQSLQHWATCTSNPGRKHAMKIEHQLVPGSNRCNFICRSDGLLIIAVQEINLNPLTPFAAYFAHKPSISLVIAYHVLHKIKPTFFCCRIAHNSSGQLPCYLIQIPVHHSILHRVSRTRYDWQQQNQYIIICGSIDAALKST
jgi:hypothetical protein